MSRYWKSLIGDKAFFSLECRIFHAICIVFVICVLLYTPISIVILTPQLLFIITTAACITSLLYYLSRFKGLHVICAILFQLLINLTLVVNYYYNSGIDGPTISAFLITFLVSAATSPLKQYYIWLPLNILLVTGMMLLDLGNPNFIIVTYSDRTARFVDVLTTYYGIIVFACVITVFVRTAYYTQRRELLAQSVALQEANQTKNKLLSILGHDLKEPLASLQGYLELLENVDLDEDEKKEMNGLLLSMTKNTSQMLTNILAWARSQDKSIAVNIQIQNVSATLEQVITVAEGIAYKKRVSIEHFIDPNIYALCDAQMLELIVRNLLTNAIKFTPNGGHVLLNVENKNAQCFISVKDDGVGIPESIQADVFSFKIGSRRGTNAEKGNGIGLKLCKEFSEMMNGSLTFISSEAGTVFTLKLPAVGVKVAKATMLEKEVLVIN